MKIEQIILDSDIVRLEPIQKEHLRPLCEIGFDKEIWRWYPFTINTKKKMLDYMNDAIEHFELGTQLAFVTIQKATNKIVGSTRFMNIDLEHKRAEIGSTWINPNWQRTSINTEAKLLMLEHAFEIWECIRVELKTDALNEKSRNAILRIGAKAEGTLRQHIITESGRFRDTVYYSIIDSEWQDVRTNLEAKLRSY